MTVHGVSHNKISPTLPHDAACPPLSPSLSYHGETENYQVLYHSEGKVISGGLGGVLVGLSLIYASMKAVQESR